jgi:mono/diheme cytochrome c family protein
MKTFTARGTVNGLVWLLGLAAAVFLLFAWRSTITPIDPPSADKFAAASIRDGAQLAALGGCATCHTAPGGETFAGGRAVPTPFGTIYSTNITPDPTSGIGRWSQSAFQRAMREGVDREGNHLYPAFPYDHFTLVSDSDNYALYAYLMTRQPVQARPPSNQLSFPLNMRLVLAGWKLLFLRQGPYEPDPTHDERWNRGAYLANGLAHCGGCHTPRNGFGAEIRPHRFGGGEAEGWHGYAINSASQSHEPWDAEALHAFLRNGWHDSHGDAHGPMAPVTANLAAVPDADVQAIAMYVAWAMNTPSRPGQVGSGAAPNAPAAPPDAPAWPDNAASGAAIYAAACAACHDGTGALPFGGIKLTLSTAVTGESAANLINVVLDGLHPPEGTAGAIMPGFSSTLTDGQLESLVAYVRSNFGAKRPWSGIEASVREARGRDRD